MPIGMKRYRTVAEMEAILRLRRPDPSDKLATDQVVGQMITFTNGLQYRHYKKYSFSCVGARACADSWGSALKTGEPLVSIPCYAERKFGGVLGPVYHSSPSLLSPCLWPSKAEGAQCSHAT